MKLYFFVMILLSSLRVIGDTVNFSAIVLDDITGNPLANVSVGAGFTMDAGPVWENRFKYDHKQFITDANGVCKISGKSNCGKAGCYIRQPPQGFYKPVCGSSLRFKGKSFFGVWQPDNLVVTLRLDRVEKPIPLFVKRVELTNSRKGIGGFDGTNCVVRFDLMKGDWMPPYGKGKTADLEFKTVLEIKGKERKFRYASRKVEDVLFYELATGISPCSTDDAISKVQTNEKAGIKIRLANDDFPSRYVVRLRGMRKQVRPKFPKEWNCEYYSNYNKSQCYQFRVRTRYDEKGKLKEAYYGKIYGDFEIQGDEKRGIISISFLYYLNPTSLDRNLEWDMKNNLCPEPGVINSPRAP